MCSFLLLLREIFSETPRPGRWRAAVCAVVSVACSAAGYLLLTPVTAHADELLDFIATVVSVCAVPFLFRKPRFFRALAVLFIYYATLDTLWSFLSSLFHAGIVPELLFESLLAGTVLLSVLLGADRRDLNVLAGAFHEIPVWLIFSLLLFELTCYYKEFGVSTEWYNVLYAFSACLILLSVLYLAFRVFRLVSTQNSILQQLNEQLLYETRREQSDESVRRFRHDFKNHTIVLNAMLEQGDVDGAKRYFDGIAGDVSGVTPRFTTGNSVVDSLLNIKSAAAAACETEIVFEGMIPANGVEPKDMCVCVGNLIDNALEACAALQTDARKTVSFSAGVKNSSLLIAISNPAKQRGGQKKDALPATTKSDKRSHGIGLKNVRDIAKKYNGTLQLHAEGGMFTAELLLELRQDE